MGERDEACSHQPGFPPPTTHSDSAPWAPAVIWLPVHLYFAHLILSKQQQCEASGSRSVFNLARLKSSIHTCEFINNCQSHISLPRVPGFLQPTPNELSKSGRSQRSLLDCKPAPRLKAEALQNRTTCIKGKRTYSLCRAGLGPLKTESPILMLHSVWAVCLIVCGMGTS